MVSAAQSEAVKQALEAFCGADPGRAAAFAPLAAPAGVIGKNHTASLPAASVAKLAVAMAAADKFASGALDPAQRIAVADLPATRYCSVLKGFDEGARLSLREVCRLSLITSDNPLSIKLMQIVSREEIAQTLRANGAVGSSVAAGFTETELGPANRVNVTTAADCLALLAAIAAKPAYAFLRTALENNLRNTRIPRLLPEEVIVAHKTGSLQGVVNDVGLVSGAHPFAIAFLTDGQADPWAAEAEIAACAMAVYAALNA